MTTRRRVGAWVAALVGGMIVGVGAAQPAHAATANVMFANVAKFGTLVSGYGVSSVTWLGPGQYEVTFTSNVSGCAYVSTTLNAGTQALQSFTAGGHVSANGVYVETKNQGGGLSDGSFSLVVACDTVASKFAVVDYSGSLARGSSGTTVTTVGPGRYQVGFNASVKNCAYLATVGDPASALVYSPAGVYTAWGANSKSVYVETKNPGGGLSAGIPFHLAVICPKTTNVHAVVTNAAGLATRGSALTASYKAGTGSFVVVNNQIGTCATVATRGSVDKAVPFTPATVELQAGPAANTAIIQVRQLLFGGGSLLDEAFHAATICH